MKARLLQLRFLCSFLRAGFRLRLAWIPLCFCAALLSAQTPVSAPDSTWRFAVSGDSRNCGDVVMPAIARGAREHGAAFYWHLGDLRFIARFDEDMAAERQKQRSTNPAATPLGVLEYQNIAWNDFISHQIDSFGAMPFFVGIGNHEVIPPKTRLEFLAQFADWLGGEPLRSQRLRDNPSDHMLHTYYHWIRDGVDFLFLDNASPLEFDDPQMKWAAAVLARDASDATIRAIVVGMHEALPESRARSHSMSEFPQEETSGVTLYHKLLEFNARGKSVYVIASHSHFYMENIFDTPYWRAHGGVLPGWIIGTAGAHRYALPEGVPPSKAARQDTYGYLLMTVHPPGAPEAVTAEFIEVQRTEIPAEVRSRYPDGFVDWCFDHNTDTHPTPAPPR